MKLASEPLFLDYIKIIARFRKNGKRQQPQIDAWELFSEQSSGRTGGSG
jgi:hypothetical protein